MKKLTLTQFGNPILRKKTGAVPRKLLRTAPFKRLVTTMFDALRKVDGVGLAAPQIGKSLSVAVIDIQPTKLRPKMRTLPKKVIINSTIVAYSKEKELGWEGCLSLDGVRGLVPRSKWVRVKFLDDRGVSHIKKITGFEAKVFQHEIDHLNGTLYVDRMQDMKSLMTLPEFKRRVLKIMMK